jgi:hypothetical protein
MPQQWEWFLPGDARSRCLRIRVDLRTQLSLAFQIR